MKVGPRSAGAKPGPVCYGLGGTEPTVTDANVIVGHLPPRLLGGEMELDVEAAKAAVQKIADALGLDLHQAAEGILDIVNENMAGALRLVSVQRGYDPRDFALVAFGGAGPLHACALAEELGMQTVLVPAAAGVLSALGLVASEERRDTVRSVVRPLAEAGELPAEGEADLRYRGQSFELTLPLGGDLAAAFHRAHEERYGYAEPGRELELVAVRTTEIRNGPEIRLQVAKSHKVSGPRLVALEGASCWVPDGWSGATDAHGTLVLQR
jgi:N-methylhydantoinase A/oxoprolinase/acetone carboxylase beta subunit